MNKKNIIQIIAWVIVVCALILNFAVLWWWEHEKLERKNPLDITKFEDIDERFLEKLITDSWMTADEIKKEMELDSNSWKTLFSILEEKWIEVKWPENNQRNNWKQWLKDERKTEKSELSNIDTSVYNKCIQNTKDWPECKDCCDCLSDSEVQTRTECRDSCATHDFSTNSDFIYISATSNLGEDWDYSQCSTLKDSKSCKSCCESSIWLQCWDYRHCRTACNNIYWDLKDNNPQKVKMKGN